MFFRLAFGSMVDLSKIKEMSPKLLCSTSERVTAMLGMGALPSARNFFSFSSVRLWMASSVPFFSTGSFADVGLSNKLDSELVGRKPVKRSHGQVVGTAIMDGKLLCKIVQ